MREFSVFDKVSRMPDCATSQSRGFSGCGLVSKCLAFPAWRNLSSSSSSSIFQVQNQSKRFITESRLESIWSPRGRVASPTWLRVVYKLCRAGKKHQNKHERRFVSLHKYLSLARTVLSWLHDQTTFLLLKRVLFCLVWMHLATCSLSIDYCAARGLLRLRLSHAGRSCQGYSFQSQLCLQQN